MMGLVDKLVKSLVCETSIFCGFESHLTPQNLIKGYFMIKKVNVSKVQVAKEKLTIEQLSTGMLVWFFPEDSIARVGLIVKITSRGVPKIDILWQKSGENYTVKRVKIDDIVEKVYYETIEKHDLAVKNFCDRVLKEGSNPTGASIEAIEKLNIAPMA